MKMANFVAVGMAALIVFAFVLVYVNRASSEVVGAALPVAFAAFSALGLVFAFGNPQPVERSFPVVFVFQQADKYPIVIPDRPFPSLTLGVFDEAVQVNPKLLQDSRFADRSGGPLFHYFLQKALVDWLASNYFNTWRVRVERFEVGGEQSQTSPAPDAKEFATKKLSAEDLKRALRTNAFATVSAFGPGTLALPPNTSFIVQELHSDVQQGEVSEIRLKNWFCDVRIQTRFSMSGVGLGAYTLVVPIPQEQAQRDYYNVQFIVRI
jgi:hypothetical protein